MIAPAILIGCTYALLAVGYAVAYSSLNMINFAHGEVLMTGALAGYVVLEFGTSLGMTGATLFAAALGAAALAGAITAYLIQKMLYKPLRKRGRLSLILAALGASMTLQQVAFLALRMQGSGSSERRLPLAKEPETVALGLSLSEFAGLLLLAVSAVALVWLVRRTLFGIRLRAIAYSPDGLKRLKQPVDLTISQAFALGGMIAGAAGLVYAKDELIAEVRQREELCSTALMPGLALPHPRHPLPYGIAASFVVVGLTSTGVPYGAVDGSLTRLFFLICSKDDRTHLHVLARIGRMLHDQGQIDGLLAAGSAEELGQVLLAKEQGVEGEP